MRHWGCLTSVQRKGVEGNLMPVRYLDADQVKMQTSAPLFVEEGRCLWCNKPLTGKATKYCRPTEEWKARYRYNYVDPVVSQCCLGFSTWWYQRPAYVRATFIRDNFTCQGCGYHKMLKDRPWLPDMSKLECDHIIPLARGGETEMGNLQTLCKECNRKKGVSMPGEAGQELPRVIASMDKSKCPHCRASGYRVLPWQPPECLDPLMIRVECLRCGAESYIAPLPWGRRREPGL